MLKIPHCLYSRLIDGGEVVSLSVRAFTDHAFLPRKIFFCFWYSFLLEAEYTTKPSAA
jgi:hypothetical protein